MRWGIKAALAAAGMMAALASQAGVVRVWGEPPFSLNLSTINNFYNGLPGHTSSIATGTLDTISLSGVDLLWAVQPGDSYTAAELSTMASFLGAGGRIAFMGEHGVVAAAQNDRINEALSALGASITIQNTIVDAGFRTASVGDGQILSHPLTTGVNTYLYAAFAPLILSGSAEALMLGEQPSVMMAFQNLGAGSVFLITDQNVWDGAPNWDGTFDNGRMFENLLIADTVVQVPEPATLALSVFALVGALASRRQAQGNAQPAA